MNQQEKKDKAIDLDNSRPFNINRYSSSTEVDEIVDQIYEKMEKLPDFKGRVTVQKKHIRAIVLDLIAV